MTTTPTTSYYRTSDGKADYLFSFEQRRGSFRVYILAQPSYGARDDSLVVTHRLTDRGRYYVCWTLPLEKLEDAKKVAALWADNTQLYIARGKRF